MHVSREQERCAKSDHASVCNICLNKTSGNLRTEVSKCSVSEYNRIERESNKTIGFVIFHAIC
jgi:hypothetical protein